MAYHNWYLNTYVYIYIIKLSYFQLHACYNASNDKYTIHRALQAYETANFIRVTSTDSDLAVLAGDLNSNPNDICYKLICVGANMIDSYSAVIKKKKISMIQY